MYSWHSFHELFAFGSKLLISGLLDTVYRNIYPIVIGKLFSASDLGHYTRAHHFSEFPSSNLTGIIQRVTYPVLCEIQNDDIRLTGIYRRFLKLSAFIIFPLMIGLSSIAKPLVNLMLGLQWEFCGQLLQIICFSMMWFPIHAINLNLLQVKGRSDLFLRLEIIKKILGVSVLCVTAPFGLIVMCYGQIFNSLVALTINTYYTGKLINVGYFRQMGDLMPIVGLGLVMFGVVLLMTHAIPNMFAQIIVGGAVGAVVYLGGAMLFKFSELEDVKYMLKRSK